MTDSLPDETVIGRYVELPKLLDILLSNRLYLAKLSDFEDPLDGEFTSWGSGGHAMQLDLPQGWLQATTRARDRARVSCWHDFTALGSEAEFLWRRYAHRGFLMRTTVERLRRYAEAAYSGAWRLDKAIYLATRVIPAADIVFCKQRAYRPEQEIRLVIDEPGASEIKIDALEMIDSITLSPALEEWEQSCISRAIGQLIPEMKSRIWPSEIRHAFPLRRMLEHLKELRVDPEVGGRIITHGPMRISAKGVDYPGRPRSK